MHTELSQDQIDSYQERGFLVIPDFLSPTELETWREAVDAAVAARGKQKTDKPGWNQNEETYYDRVFIQRLNLWKDNPEVKKLILNPGIGKMAARLAGVSGIRVWHDQALIKEPWANPTSFHLDVPYWSFDSRDAISIWVALDDATLENGCLFYVPGSHTKTDYRNVGIGENMRQIFDLYPEFQTTAAVAAPMKAGSCGFHNGLTIHGAHGNMTPGYRRAMTCAFMPDGCTFNGKQNILTKEQVSALKVGNLLEDNAQNPLIYAEGQK